MSHDAGTYSGPTNRKEYAEAWFRLVIENGDRIGGHKAGLIELMTELDQLRATARAGVEEPHHAFIRKTLGKRLVEAYDRAIEALVWCSGSADFGPGGQAREGWVKGPQQVIQDFTDARAMLSGGVDEAIARTKRSGLPNGDTK